jgi:hypothetical protein
MIKLNNNLLVFTAPEEVKLEENVKYVKIFLAGTIDMGNSYNWQENFIKKLKDTVEKNNITDKIFIVFNPRRDEMMEDSSLETVQTQATWEMDMMDKSDLIFMNILSTSKSPISLLELGLYSKSGKLLVRCTPEFYRFANVKTVCERFDIKLVTNKKISLTEILEFYNEIKPT